MYNLKASGIVLAGGKSLRLDADKRLVKIGNQSLIERSISLVAPVVDEVIVVSSQGKLPSLMINDLNVRIVSDVYSTRVRWPVYMQAYRRQIHL